MSAPGRPEVVYRRAQPEGTSVWARSHAEDAVGAELRRARIAAGWTQRDLALRAGVHQPQVVRAERGDDIQVSLLVRLARPLGFVARLGLPAADNHADPAASPVRDRVGANIDSWRAAWPQIDPEVFAILARLAEGGRQVTSATQQSAALHGMTGREMVVLGALRRKGPPFESTPTGLKQFLWLSLPGLKKRVDRLQALGMVTRVDNPSDRRGLMVRLTPRGHAVLDDVVMHAPATVYRALLDMAPAERTQLSGLLADLLARADNLVHADKLPAP